MTSLKQSEPFQKLSPDAVINSSESALEKPLSNLCRPLNSYINRVYELEDLDGNGIIAKFYRPGRWSGAALQDEHDFLLELAEEEISVVPPLKQKGGGTLGQLGEISFALFEKKGGRSYDEYNVEQWLELGRLLGRTHMVGARKGVKDRMTIAPTFSFQQQVDYLLATKVVVPEQRGIFQAVCGDLLACIGSLFAHSETIRIHGDCHFSNIIYRPGESFYIIDFDDMSIGPPVQDLWMLLPGYIEHSRAEVELFLEGYQTFHHFDRRSLALVEPLRAMRYIHYTAWCAHQFVEDGFSPVAPDFGSFSYWQKEIDDLKEQLARIEDSITDHHLF